MNGLGATAACVTSFVVTSVLGIWAIPLLHRLKFGQSIRDVGPTWHKYKQGTPTMGGFLFITGSLLGLAAFWLTDLSVPDAVLGRQQVIRLWSGVLMALAFGFIGFMDDYVKVVKKRNLGLTARQKLLLQMIVAAAFLATEYLTGMKSTMFVVPFFGWTLDFGVFYWPVSLLLIAGFVNAVNLTDGVDGLCGSVTFVASLGMMLFGGLLSLAGFAAFGAAIAGGCLGFLVWNLHPAKVFMGDTGSLFLGGALCAMAFGMGMPLLLLPVGIIYIVEMFSVIIQVISFKTTGHRVFKMSPIHHHFELCGWSEMKIVAVFTAVTFVLTAGTLVWELFARGIL